MNRGPGIDAPVRTIEILLVEDNPADVRLTLEALKEGRIANRLSVATDGLEAIAFLNREGLYAKAARPDLILLDLNLPRKGGIEVLTTIKTDDRWKRIPVVILTTSKAEDDIVRSYNNWANCYITKPVDLNEFMRVVQSIEDFWFSIVQLPPRGRGERT